MNKQEIQIGILRLARPFPIKADLLQDNHHFTVLAMPGNHPLFLNRNYPGKEVRCHPTTRVVGHPEFNYRIAWTWSEHEVAASVMHAWLAAKPGYWDFQIDQTVVTPIWTYKSESIREVVKQNWGEQNRVPDRLPKTIESIEWGEAIFEDPA